MTLLKEYELLFNLAYEWEVERLLEAPIGTPFSEDNPYKEPLEIIDRERIKEEANGVHS